MRTEYNLKKIHKLDKLEINYIIAEVLTINSRLRYMYLLYLEFEVTDKNQH